MVLNPARPARHSCLLCSLWESWSWLNEHPQECLIPSLEPLAIPVYLQQELSAGWEESNSVDLHWWASVCACRVVAHSASQTRGRPTNQMVGRDAQTPRWARDRRRERRKRNEDRRSREMQTICEYSEEWGWVLKMHASPFGRWEKKISQLREDSRWEQSWSINT